MTVGISTEQIQAIATWAKTKPRILSIILFGSRAKGSHRADSDIDLAVELSEDRSYSRATIWMYDRFGWQDQLAELLGMKVDVRILDLGEDSRIRRFCADAGNIVLYEKAPPG